LFKARTENKDECPSPKLSHRDMELQHRSLLPYINHKMEPGMTERAALEEMLDLVLDPVIRLQYHPLMPRL